MGYSFSSDDEPEYCFNAAKLYTLGWFSARSQTISSSGTTSYSGNIADMTQNPDAAGSPILFYVRKVLCFLSRMNLLILSS